MNALQELQPEVGASQVTRLGGRRFAAAALAAIAVGILAQPAPAQTPFTITMEMNSGGAVVPATVTVPDPFAVAEQALGCADVSASCMRDLLQAAAPGLGQLPPRPAPPASPGSSQPEEPASPPPKDGPQASPGTPAPGVARVPDKRPPAPESASLASRPELAEVLSSAPPVQGREVRRPLPTHDVPPRGPDLSGGSAPAAILPAALPGSDWSPLPLNMFLAAGSLALLFFLLMATPQHSVGHVSYWLADRRVDLGLLGVVMLVGLAVGYFIATSLGK